MFDLINSKIEAMLHPSHPSAAWSDASDEAEQQAEPNRRPHQVVALELARAHTLLARLQAKQKRIGTIDTGDQYDALIRDVQDAKNRVQDLQQQLSGATRAA